MRKYGERYSDIARRQAAAPSGDLNLTPILNMVMVIIPLLVLMVAFTQTGVINISTPRAQADNPAPTPPVEETPIPSVVVAISHDGFRVFDRRNLSGFAPFVEPVAGCGSDAEVRLSGSAETIASNPPTICNRGDAGPSASLLERLDFAALYDHLVAIRLHPEWFEAFADSEEGGTFSVLADPEIPYEVVVATMDAARQFLAVDTAAPPSAGSDPAHYQLGAGGVDVMGRAQPLRHGGRPVELFPNPMLVLPRPQG